MNDRETAVYILMDIINEKGYNNIILKKALRNNNGFTAAQKAFITEAVNGSLRNLQYIDYVINQFSVTKTTKMKPFILSLLRISVYQILYMNKTPESAVCNEAVKIAKKRGFQGLSGFVNGVLRNIVRNVSNIRLPDKNNAHYLSVKYSYNEWLIEYWLKQYDYETAEKILEAGNRAPDVTVCANLLKINADELFTILTNEGVAVRRGRINQNCLHLSGTGDLTKLNSYKDGLFHVMDESAAVAVDVLNPKSDGMVFDICAAPGGKSFYTAYLMKNSGNIYSRDIYEHKLQLLNDSMERLGINIIKTQLKDATAVYEEDFQKADYVLADVPCTGFGLLRKKPDIKYRKTYEEVLALSKQQRDILGAASNYVKAGGVLVYSTCTVSEEENLNNIKWFTEQYPFELEDISPYQRTGISTEKLGYIQILTHMYDTDGFFIARMRRKHEN